MAIAANMMTSRRGSRSHDESEEVVEVVVEVDKKTTTEDEENDDHEHDMVMPGFRFHPTEEELVEFYLRRKVEGKRFNVELITFLDLYRYDPWELPALAAIGEKEWFFYVPRDRKYRNGDRPNRVTTSGYWKATGADRMIRSDNHLSSRSIGLKKTLVFYSGKAPKGIRTSWIMNEYRLPHHETERYQKAEISLCRVYKRAGVEDHPSLPRILSNRPSSSRGIHPSNHRNHQHHQQQQQHQHAAAQHQAVAAASFGSQSQQQMMELEKPDNTDIITTTLVLSKPQNNAAVAAAYNATMVPPNIGTTTTTLLAQALLPINCTTATLFSAVCGGGSSSSCSLPHNADDDLHTLVNFQQHQHHHQQQQQQQQWSTSAMALNTLSGSLPAAAFSDRLWEWNPIQESNHHRDFNNNPFK